MNLQTMKGLGEKNEQLLNSLNIFSIEDLIEYYPYKYIEYKINDINEIQNDSQVVVVGTIESLPISRYFRAKLNSLNFKLNTNGKLINITIYNRAFIKNHIVVGKRVTITGKYNVKKNIIVANNILFSEVQEGSTESVYHLTQGINNKQMIKLIDTALKMSPKVIDYIPLEYKEKYKFISKEEAIRKIHHPYNINDTKKAKIRLIYEELFEFMFKINYLKYVKKKDNNKQPKKVELKELQEFLGMLPFELTEDQKKSINEIHKDLTSHNRMNRLLCGDVGSGKTIVGITASYECYLAGYQTALMAPTEILATQHYNNVCTLLEHTNMKVALLLGSTKRKDKEIIYEELKNGKIDLLIGTHSLISDRVKFKNLGLVITDEQHRFGVNQRNSLRNKGLIPDILYMSATPIPRTYALTVYGDMDVSLIKTKPSGRKEIKTVIKSEKEIKDVLYMMLEEIKKNHQIYVVTPLIEETENSELTTVNDLKNKLDIAFNKKIEIASLHGKLEKEDKEKIMKDFKNGKTKILVSTTVIEVGVDVPNATMMIIFNAERFGLATLHQLRGRIGRNSLESTCILMGSKSNKRLKVLEESTDGFYITEKDFEMRKEGDLFGQRQSGEQSFKIASINNDFKILLAAKEDSEEFLLKNIRNNFKNNEKYYKIINEIKSLD